MRGLLQHCWGGGGRHTQHGQVERAAAGVGGAVSDE
jgi:hypothetical protein